MTDDAAVCALLDVTAEHGSSAGFDRRHHAAFNPAEMAVVFMAILDAVTVKDIRHFERRAHNRPQAGGTTSMFSRSNGLTVRPMTSVETWAVSVNSKRCGLPWIFETQ
jgi:hypothetical protein